MSTKQPLKRGRSSRYTEELAERICQIVEEGNGLATACRIVSESLKLETGEVICDSTVYGWKKDLPVFAERYARARQIQVERMADEILDIANGSVPTEGITTWDQLQRDRLKIDTRKFLLAKVLPKTFGDKLAVAQDTQLTVTLVDETQKPKAGEQPQGDDED
jgi:hypothetical protein